MNIWVSFWMVAIIWGSSFMLIRIGVAEVHPLHLVFIRTGIAAVGLGLVMVALRKRIPRDRKTLLSLIVIGMGNNALPFLLISWGEQHIESGLASVLQSTAALFTLVVAHFVFADERITRRKVIGLVCGFIGVVVLASRNWQEGGLDLGGLAGLAGQLAIVGASLSYATFTTFSRKVIRGQIEPIVLSAVAMTSAAFTTGILSLIAAAFFDVPFATPVNLPLEALLAILTLGVVNTFIAYLLFYNIVRVLGAARAAMVTYIVPVVGLILGVLFMGEKLDVFIVGGAALIFTGIGIVNLKRLPFLRPKPARLEAAVSGD